LVKYGNLQNLKSDGTDFEIILRFCLAFENPVAKNYPASLKNPVTKLSVLKASHAECCLPYFDNQSVCLF
jgi:hypothetical protein